jgi:hypothetical protein
MEDYRNGKISHVEFHQNLTDGLLQKMKKYIYGLAKVSFVANKYGRKFEFAIVFSKKKCDVKIKKTVKQRRKWQ